MRSTICLLLLSIGGALSTVEVKDEPPKDNKLDDPNVVVVPLNRVNWGFFRRGTIKKLAGKKIFWDETNAERWYPHIDGHGKSWDVGWKPGKASKLHEDYRELPKPVESDAKKPEDSDVNKPADSEVKKPEDSAANNKVKESESNKPKEDSESNKPKENSESNKVEDSAPNKPEEDSAPEAPEKATPEKPETPNTPKEEASNPKPEACLHRRNFKRRMPRPEDEGKSDAQRADEDEEGRLALEKAARLSLIPSKGNLGKLAGDNRNGGDNCRDLLNDCKEVAKGYKELAEAFKQLANTDDKPGDNSGEKAGVKSKEKKPEKRAMRIVEHNNMLLEKVPSQRLGPEFVKITVPDKPVMGGRRPLSAKHKGGKSSSEAGDLGRQLWEKLKEAKAEQLRKAKNAKNSIASEIPELEMRTQLDQAEGQAKDRSKGPSKDQAKGQSFKAAVGLDDDVLTMAEKKVEEKAEKEAKRKYGKKFGTKDGFYFGETKKEKQPESSRISADALPKTASPQTWKKCVKGKDQGIKMTGWQAKEMEKRVVDFRKWKMGFGDKNKPRRFGGNNLPTLGG